jgi:hypothetical protein
MKMKKSLALAIGSLLISGVAMATAPAPATQTLGFDDLKAACQNPAAYHNQIAPSNIQVSCVDVQTKWVADTGSSITQPNTREVTASVTSDKYSVNAVITPIVMPNQTIACDQFKEISETINTVRAVTCADLIAFTGESSDFCAQSSDSMRVANPSAVVTVDTGRTLSLCNDSPATTPTAPAVTPPTTSGN